MRSSLFIVLMKLKKIDVRQSCSVRDFIGELLNKITPSQHLVPNRFANKLHDKGFNKSYEIFSKKECEDIYIMHTHMQRQDTKRMRTFYSNRFDLFYTIQFRANLCQILVKLTIHLSNLQTKIKQNASLKFDIHMCIDYGFIRTVNSSQVSFYKNKLNKAHSMLFDSIIRLSGHYLYIRRDHHMHTTRADVLT
jgi:hypothetical protein